MTLVAIDEDGRVSLAADDPTASVPAVVEQSVALYGRRGFEPPWIVYLAAQDGTWVGSCGFAGPAADGEVEIAYFTFPQHEGRGIATGMAIELLAQTGVAARSRGVAFVAHTLPQEGPSPRILRRLGFSLIGPIVHPEDGTVWKWRRTESV
jgi:RimJ/RimL family protein N-acetyltransferase